MTTTPATTTARIATRHTRYGWRAAATAPHKAYGRSTQSAADAAERCANNLARQLGKRCDRLDQLAPEGGREITVANLA